MNPPTERQIVLATEALVPFVQQWNLALNPEDLGEMAWAVLTNFDREGPDDVVYDEVNRAVTAQLDEFVRLNAMGRPMEKPGASSSMPGDPDEAF